MWRRQTSQDPLPSEVYTKPKKIPHKHKKVKLAVLKYYKVDANMKVSFDASR